MKKNITALLLCSSTLALSSALSAPLSWQGEVIYQVMPDRFFDGNSANNAGVNKAGARDWHGGDLKGLTQKLEYIKNLGATVVWLTPIYVQPASKQFNTAGYHGYWPWEFQNVDPHYGTLEEFNTFVDKAHTLGLKVMLDQVVNHFGYGAPTVSSKPDWFHKDGSCSRLGNNEIFCPLSGLPDLAQENPQVKAFLFENNAFWTAQGVDGFRYDAVKHVPLEFMGELAAQNVKDGVFTLGEVFETSLSSTAKIASFQKAGLTSMFDFPLQSALNNAIMGERSFDAVRIVLEKDEEYANPAELAIFLDNHDVPRFASRSPLLGEEEVNARAIYGVRALLTLRGIPTLWQGTEIAQRGGVDPDNRRSMRFEDVWTPAEKTVFEATQKALSVYKASSALKGGVQQMLPVPEFQTDDLMLFTRTSSEQTVLVAWNNAATRKTYSLKLSKLPKEFATLKLEGAKDLFGQDAKVSVQGGYFHVTLPARAATAFEAQ